MSKVPMFVLTCDRENCFKQGAYDSDEEAFNQGWRGCGVQMDAYGHILAINRWLCFEHALELWGMWRNP